MTDLIHDYKIFPLGDAGVTIDLGNVISISLNLKIRSMQQWLVERPLDGIKDIIAGYSSLSILYDPVIIKRKYSPAYTAYEFMQQKLLEAWTTSPPQPRDMEERLLRIPVCYGASYGPDLEHIAETAALSIDEVIRHHYERHYYIYMIGFLPGFSYMAEINEKLVMSRKPNPVMVAAGSVGIAGNQTGIYPLQCPGGWQILGRTPLRLFDREATIPVLLKAGDRVEFFPISTEEFEAWDGVTTNP